MKGNRRLLLGEIYSKNIGDLAIVEVAELNLDVFLKRSLSPHSVDNKWLFHLKNFIYTIELVILIKSSNCTIVTIYGGQIIRNNFHWAFRIWVMSIFSEKIELLQVGVDNSFNTKTLFFWKKALSTVNSVTVRDNKSFQNFKDHFDITPEIKKDSAYQLKPEKYYTIETSSVGVFMSYQDFKRHNNILSEKQYIEFHDYLIEKYQIKSILCSTQSDFEYWSFIYREKCEPFVDDVYCFINHLCKNRLIISSRMHPLIFGEINSKLLGVINISDKLDGYAKELERKGYENYFICNI